RAPRRQALERAAPQLRRADAALVERAVLRLGPGAAALRRASRLLPVAAPPVALSRDARDVGAGTAGGGVRGRGLRRRVACALVDPAARAAGVHDGAEAQPVARGPLAAELDDARPRPAGGTVAGAGRHARAARNGGARVLIHGFTDKDIHPPRFG